MKIGIIGSGNMGRSLGLLWAEQGHQVFFGARTAEQGRSVAEFARSYSILAASTASKFWVAQSQTDLSTPFIVSPSGVSEYSTIGGTTG